MTERFSNRIYAKGLLPERPERSNKYTFGQVAVVGGCPGMAGAAYFSAKAAYRSGCGLARIVSPEENRVVYQALLPEAVLTLYDGASPDENAIKNAVCRASAVVLGVGLGRSETAKALVRFTLEAAASPLVIDADGLNILASDKELMKLVPTGTVITPHAAEMSRLSGIPVSEINADIPETAEEFAREHGIVCVLKDRNTAVSDGKRTAVNETGNSGMATAGSGDVLSGIVAAMLAQGLAPFDAAALGVYLHGLAGDAAAEKLTEYSVTASDIIENIPEAIKRTM